MFSLGLVLWCIGSGEALPFAECSDSEQVIYEICVENSRPAFNDQFDAKLKPIIESCWQKTAKTRPKIKDVLKQIRQVCTAKKLI